jgi:hypothetical protein
MRLVGVTYVETERTQAKDRGLLQTNILAFPLNEAEVHKK